MKQERRGSIEGDLILTKDGSFFDVKGLIHPPKRIISFIRYFMNSEGTRKKNGATYAKVYSLSERYALLKKRLPRYLVHDQVFDETLCEVPIHEVKKTYRPTEKLQEMRRSRELDALESKALQQAELLKEEANIPWGSIGISGSIAIGLHTADSDIDPIVYGSQNCWKVYMILKEMCKNKRRSIKPYTQEDLRTLFDFRSKDSSANFESFVRTESRKAMQGKFAGTDYFVRFVKDWDEVDEAYGDVRYKNVGVAEIRATIEDDSEAIFTPCIFKISNTRVLDGPHVGDIEEIVSFRGRFCEQAKAGEEVVVRGKLEHVEEKKRGREYFRLLLGNQKSDFMILT
jgi:predicted nucleotidyltransferase